MTQQIPLFQFTRLLSEGTAEPFVARLWVNVLELRDTAINARLRGGTPEQHKRQFDDLYNPVLTALQECREAAKEGRVPVLVEKRSGAFFRLVKCTTSRPPWQAATGGTRHGQTYQEASSGARAGADLAG